MNVILDGVEHKSIRPCWYCAKRLSLTSPEHVIARALGGGLVIFVCGPCNKRANDEVDRPLAALDDLRRERARLGLRDPRTNQPTTFSETLEAEHGIRLRATYSADGIDARFLPIEIPRPGTIVTDLFIDSRDAEEHARKIAERAAKRGLTVGRSISVDDWPDAPEPRFREGEEFVFVARAGGRRHPAWVWPAAAAKIILGCLCDGVHVGAWPARTVDELVVHGLRMLAFDHHYSPDLWDSEDIWPGPRRPSPTHPVAGRLAPDEHAVAIYDAASASRGPLAQIVLFGRMLVELPLPGLAVASSLAWVLSTRDRRVKRDTPEAIAQMLLGRRRVERQLAFA